MKEKILIIVHSEVQHLYERILQDQGYITKVLKSEDYTAQVESDCIEKVVEEVLKFCPKLIVCQYVIEVCSKEVVEILQRIHRAFNQDDCPLNLVLLARDSFPTEEYQFLIDEFISDPVQVKPFLETVKGLLTSRD